MPASRAQLAQVTRSVPRVAVINKNHATLGPIRQVAIVTEPKTEMSLASVGSGTPAFVLDYHLLLDSTPLANYTFRGDTTYFITDSISLSGNIRIEGGTVIKFAQYVSFFVDAEASLVCDTTNYLPAVFTCYTDNSIGTELGTHSISQYESAPFYFFSGSWEFRNVRFTHLAYPFVSEGGTITLRNAHW